MGGQAGKLRFEYGALGFVFLSIVSLYAAVLSMDTAGRVAPAWLSERPPRVGATITGARLRAVAARGPKVLAVGMSVDSVETLVRVFRRVDYRLDSLRLGAGTVPHILVDEIPSDLEDVDSPSERKRVFIKLMLPLILHVNERILDDRERLIALRDKAKGSGGALRHDERAWLQHVSARYGLETIDMAALLRRVDVVPPSLALAQAAEESGWGTSRFVRDGNAVFGQHTYLEGAGIVPRRRDDGEDFEVKAFDGLLDSVVAYMANLNSHPAYREFRRARARQRDEHGWLDGYALAGTLEAYSERGEAYVRSIRKIIKSNGLRAFDRARLGNGEAVARLRLTV